MATVNLGRIKPVFRGAYNSSTAYVVDDIVTDSNETFICILASTGNATSNATYWTKLAAKGTDGTDVGTTITTQGDILYRDGSGLQRLAKPASDKFLQNTSGGVLSWESVSSDCVKLATVSATSGTSMSIDGYFSSTYNVYKIFFHDYHITSGGEWLKYRYNYGGTVNTSSDYAWAAGYNYRNNSNSTAGSEGHNSANYMGLTWWGTGSDRDLCGEITIIDPLNTSRKTTSKFSIFTMDPNQTLHQFNGGGLLNSSAGQAACSGITIFPNGGTIGSLKATLYGFK